MIDVIMYCCQGEKDWQKYETARRLHKCVDKIRAQYREDWKSKEMRIRQRAVALYFIDKVSFLGDPVVFNPQVPSDPSFFARFL